MCGIRIGYDNSGTKTCEALLFSKDSRMTVGEKKLMGSNLESYCVMRDVSLINYVVDRAMSLDRDSSIAMAQRRATLFLHKAVIAILEYRGSYRS